MSYSSGNIFNAFYSILHKDILGRRGSDGYYESTAINEERVFQKICDNKHSDITMRASRRYE